MGVLVAYEIIPFNIIEIVHIFVKKELREQKLGSRLICLLMTWAASKCVPQIYVRRSEESAGFFKKLGFTMSISIPGQNDIHKSSSQFFIQLFHNVQPEDRVLVFNLVD